MHSSFNQTVEVILQQDDRYGSGAYGFVRDALDFTVKRKGHGQSEEREHVCGPELLGGLRAYALEQFGPMVPTVFEHWGIRTTYDVGCIVFNLIGAGVFGKTERDSIEDFRDGFDFAEAFVQPFRPGLPQGRIRAAQSESACTESVDTAVSAGAQV